MLKNRFKRGGLSTSTAVSIGIILTLGILVAVGFGGYKYQSLKKYNAELSKQEEKKENSPNQEQEPAETMSIRDSDEADRQAEIDAAVKRALAEQEENVPETVSTKPTQEEVVVTTNDFEPIRVTSVRQTTYPDGFGGTYGSYEIEITVTANGADIFIPESTSNTTGTGLIGFSYSIIGGSFSGIQESKISCTRHFDDFCVIKDGQTKDIVATIWLTPDEDGDGNYAINFEQILYYLGDEQKILDVNRKTSTINIRY